MSLKDWLILGFNVNSQSLEMIDNYYFSADKFRLTYSEYEEFRQLWIIKRSQFYNHAFINRISI